MVSGCPLFARSDLGAAQAVGGVGGDRLGERVERVEDLPRLAPGSCRELVEERALEIGVTLLRFFVIRHGVMPAGRGGKLKTVLQSVTLTLFTLPLWTFPLSGAWTAAAWLTMALAVGVTLVTGIDYVVKARRLRRTSERTLLKRARAAKRG